MKYKFFWILYFCLFNLEAEITKHGTAINQMIQRFMIKRHIPGLAVAIYFDNNESFLSYGYSNVAKKTAPTPETLFELASVTKVFTTTELALQLLNGKMHVNDPVYKFVPQLKLGAIRQVTLLQLATHTSGLPEVTKGFNLDRKHYTQQMVIQFLQQWKPKKPIGSHYHYSNVGIGVIGYALSGLLNKPWEQIISEDILLPLGMNRTMMVVPPLLMESYATGYSESDQPLPSNRLKPWPASGALRSCATDMMKFLKANLGIGGPSQLLSAMQMAQRGYFKVNDGFTMGLGWRRIERDHIMIIEKNGGVPGFSSYIGMVANKKLGIVILANKDKVGVTTLGRRLLKHLVHQSK